MTKIKLCGLSRACDIQIVNELKPEYIGFVFATSSKRYVTPENAGELKNLLRREIQAVGVFVDEGAEKIAALLNDDIIDVAQLHGHEDEKFLRDLRKLTGKEIIQAFRVKDLRDIEKASNSSADYILLDSGAGTGIGFDWELTANISRQYFLAGGLDPKNVAHAIKILGPYAVDVSSGIETDGFKDSSKMREFVSVVRDHGS